MQGCKKSCIFFAQSVARNKISITFANVINKTNVKRF